MSTTKNKFNNKLGIRSAIRRSVLYFKPPEKLKPSEWAEKNCRIPAGNAIPGPVRFANVPYQVEPLNMAADPECYRISMMWGAQTGKTQTQLMAIGYYIAHEPSNQMMMQPSETDSSTWVTAKFNPMVESTPALYNKVAKPRARVGVNNGNIKSYPGGFLMLAWAGSPLTQRGRSAPKIFPDETDAYERTKEGHPVNTLWQRAATFGDQRLLFETSTPIFKGASHIEQAFEDGDQRRWYVECQDCNHQQYFKWSQVTWKKDDDGEHMPETAAYVCEECGCLWDDSQRYKAIRNGKWKALKKFKGHASYHLPEMASTFRKLKDLVISFLEKKATGDLQTFTNVSLAETWAVEGLKRDPEQLYARREHYPSELPAKAVVLTAAIDVQDDRFEVQFEGWGEQQENWKVDYQVLRGDLNNRDIWDRLDSLLDKQYKHESGVLISIEAATIDTGGHFTQETYDYVKRSRHRLFAIKGSSNKDASLVSTPSKSNLGKVNLYSLGVHKLKQQIMQRTGIKKPGPAYVHFPVSDQFELDWFDMYTAEELTTKYVKGVRRDEWKKIRPRNEAFDLSVYNLACLIICNFDFAYFKRKIEEKLYKPEQKPERKAKPSGWVNDSNGSWL